MTAGPAAVRAEVRSWLAATWQPDLPLLEWRRRLHAAGWAAPTWPAAWSGRGLPRWADAIVAEELAAVGAPGGAVGAGTALAAPTLLAHGPDGLRRRLLPRAVTGEDRWCQLFSEPGSGSDLAGLTTHASGDGGEWTVTGQKVWSTGAHHADLGLLLARTDWDVPKHRGITCFVLPMTQAGVDVRPLRQMNGHASFDEVFLTEARIPGDHVVGEVGGGWAVAMTTLAHERGFATMRAAAVGAGRAGREAADEAADHAATYRWYPQRAGRPDLLLDVAGASGRRDDPVARQRIAAVLATRSAHEWAARRAAAARAGGVSPGPEGSLGKLAASEVAGAAAAAHAFLLGATATLAGDDAPHGGLLAEVLVSVPAQSIAGGTDEIQRTILGERALGLPREPAVDRDVPFRDVRRTPRP